MTAPIPLSAFRPALCPAPIILPRDMDDLLDERAWAHVRTITAGHNLRIPFAVARRQGDYARRLDTHIARRNAA